MEEFRLRDVNLRSSIGLYMLINYLPAGGAVGVGEIEVSPVTHKCCFIRHYRQDEMKMTPTFSEDSRFPSEIQWYKNTSTGFRFWNVQCSTKCSPHPPTIQISVGGIYFNDILMGHFVISQTPENNAVVQTVVRLLLKRDFLKTKYLPLEWTLRFVTL